VRTVGRGVLRLKPDYEGLGRGGPVHAQPFLPEFLPNQKDLAPFQPPVLIFIHMDEYSPNVLDYTFAALAHPARRRILELLASEDVCVTDLAANFDCSLNVVSKHIQSLERAGLVRRQRLGRVHRLRFAPAPLADASAFIERYRERWERQFDRLASYLDEVAAKETPDEPKA
jgi:DNA-binding transcriptional ArsR family regulator